MTFDFSSSIPAQIPFLGKERNKVAKHKASPTRRTKATVTAKTEPKSEPDVKTKTPTAAQLRKAAFDALSRAEQEAQKREERIAKYRAKIAMFEDRKQSNYYEPDDLEKLSKYMAWNQLPLNPEKDAADRREADERARKRYERLLRRELGEEAPRKKGASGKKGKWGKTKEWQKKGKGGRK